MTFQITLFQSVVEFNNMNTNTESVVNYRFHTNIKDSPMPGSFSVVSFFFVVVFFGLFLSGTTFHTTV